MRVLTDQDIDRVPLSVISEAISAHMVADAGSKPGRKPQPEGDAANPGASKRISTAANDYLATIRAQCVGGIALDVMASHTAKTLALVGTGEQATAQLAAAIALRDFKQIRIYGRRPVAANEMAKAFRNKTQSPIDITGTPEEAVHGADVVILATDSHYPVIDADWVSPDAHVTSLGPKAKARHELPMSLVYRARTIATDDPHQILDNKDHMLSGDTVAKRIRHLGELIGKFNPDRGRGMTMFLSSGISGTDAVALDAVVNFLARA